MLPSSPNYDGTGHTRECGDVLCTFQANKTNACPGVPLDCNQNEYFNADPPAGSFLATHWNIANSRFLENPPPFPDAFRPACGPFERTESRSMSRLVMTLKAGSLRSR